MFEFHQWDWKGQPDFEAINASFQEIKGSASIVEIDTDSDQFGIAVFSSDLSELTQEEWNQLWNFRYADEEALQQYSLAALRNLLASKQHEQQEKDMIVSSVAKVIQEELGDNNLAHIHMLVKQLTPEQKDAVFAKLNFDNVIGSRTSLIAAIFGRNVRIA